MKRSLIVDSRDNSVSAHAHLSVTAKQYSTTYSNYSCCLIKWEDCSLPDARTRHNQHYNVVNTGEILGSPFKQHCSKYH